MSVKNFKILLNTTFLKGIIIQSHEIKSDVMSLTSDTVLRVRDGSQGSRAAPTNFGEMDG